MDKPDQKALVLYDVVKGQTTESVHKLLEDNNILFVHIPNCCADQLQPLDVSVNKSIKSFLFSFWYGGEVKKQLDSTNEVVVDMKVVSGEGSQCQLDEQAYDYMKTSEINGFEKSGIFDAIANLIHLNSDQQEDPFTECDD